MTEPVLDPRRAMRFVRLAVLLTALAVGMAVALLVRETAYVFAAFMILGPALLFVAVILLGWVILTELRVKRVL